MDDALHDDDDADDLVEVDVVVERQIRRQPQRSQQCQAVSANKGDDDDDYSDDDDKMSMVSTIDSQHLQSVVQMSRLITHLLVTNSPAIKFSNFCLPPSRFARKHYFWGFTLV